MASTTIKTRAFGNLTFHLNGSSGYVYLETHEGKGCLGLQICEGGNIKYGSAVEATEETLDAVCRKWHAQRLKVIKYPESDYGN